tara:strand:+ start:120 stop:662 length:543 start_codon:yes stop_codon:yes gene_type:complete
MINEKNVLSGGFHIQPGFLLNNEFNDLNDKIKNLDYTETHQPSNLQLGNRFQGYPCYEKNDDDITKLMYSKVKNLFKRELKSFQCVVRKVIGEELKMSKVDTQYGIIHSDNENPTFASVLQFDQTTNGGTAFFENSWDKHPDITIGSYPNRLLIYNGNRNHAPMYDFTYKQRYVIASFWY